MKFVLRLHSFVLRKSEIVVKKVLVEVVRLCSRQIKQLANLHVRKV